MNKRLFFSLGLICAILLCAVVYIATTLPKDNETACTDNDNCDTLHWVRDESRFIDYTIEDDTVFVRYAVVFENHSDVDYSCSQLSAKFRRTDLWGWMEYEKFFTGVLEDGSKSFTVHAGEKTEIVLTFCGKYTGGTVNNSLSIPERITFLQRALEP